MPWYMSSHTTINLTLSVGEKTNVCRLVNISNSVRKIMMEQFIVTGCKPAPANIRRVNQYQRGGLYYRQSLGRTYRLRRQSLRRVSTQRTQRKESSRYSAKKLCALCGKKNKSFFNYCCWFGHPMISVVRHIAK